MRTFFHTFERDNGDEVTVEFTITPFIPAQVYGPPELCYPAEGGEVEIVDAWLEATKAKVDLTDSEREHWEDGRLAETVDDGAWDDDYDYD